MTLFTPSSSLLFIHCFLSFFDTFVSGFVTFSSKLSITSMTFHWAVIFLFFPLYSFAFCKCMTSASATPFSSWPCSNFIHVFDINFIYIQLFLGPPVPGLACGNQPNSNLFGILSLVILTTWPRRSSLRLLILIAMVSEYPHNCLKALEDICLAHCWTLDIPVAAWIRLWWKASSFLKQFCNGTQHSEPYSSTDRTHASYNILFVSVWMLVFTKTACLRTLTLWLRSWCRASGFIPVFTYIHTHARAHTHRHADTWTQTQTRTDRQTDRQTD